MNIKFATKISTLINDKSAAGVNGCYASSSPECPPTKSPHDSILNNAVYHISNTHPSIIWGITIKIILSYCRITIGKYEADHQA